MVPGMNFDIVFRKLFQKSILECFFSQRRTALNEVSAAVAAAIGKAHYIASVHTPSLTGVSSMPWDSQEA
jgi:hypothetical protein